MRRILGPVLAMALVVMLGARASAQIADPELSGGSPSGGYAPFFNLPFGSFGFGYTQVIPSNGYVLNGYGMVGESPSVGTTPPVAPAQASAPVQRAAKARSGKPARPVRSAASKSGARKTYQASVRPTEPLPSGSLYWPGTGVPLYSPAQRHESYGYGYAHTPRGSIDYGSFNKGYDWDY